MSEHQTHDRPSTAHEALEALRAGHARFHAREVHGERPPHADSLELWRETQSPWATIVACSDSRVSPEIVFDATMGELFVIRTAGQTLDGASLGTIEYGVAHLGTPIVLVLGHTGCGAVMAALGDDMDYDARGLMSDGEGELLEAQFSGFLDRGGELGVLSDEQVAGTRALH